MKREDAKKLSALAGGKSLGELAKNLLNAFDPDFVVARASPPVMDGSLPCEPTPAELASARKSLLAAACAPFENNVLRDALAKAKQDAEQTIDTVTIDQVEFAGFDAAAKEKAANLTRSFRHYIEEHKSEIAALQILYSRPYKQRLNEDMLKELEAKLKQEPTFGPDPVNSVWRAFETCHSSQVTRHSGATRRFADLVSLVRFALEQQPVLEPFSDSVNERFEQWLQSRSGVPPLALANDDKRRDAASTFTPDQLAWLHLIRDHIATSLSIEPDDFG
ncbi:MAG: type I restriction-modification enzyme R subunit C-terminal domain-containing protein [Opitutaceae bacterium]|nr:type I restriction-modification enzyme R subunit C-terminal domain-containing protein [Opitutaceae bacterium]